MTSKVKINQMLLNYLAFGSSCISSTSDHVYFYKSYGVKWPASTENNTIKLQDNASSNWRFKIHSHVYEHKALHKRFFDFFRNIKDTSAAVKNIVMTLENKPRSNKQIHVRIVKSESYQNGFQPFIEFNQRCPLYKTLEDQCPVNNLQPGDITLPNTNDIGHSDAVISIANNVEHNGKLTYKLLNKNCAIGETYLINPTGITIITDIDDTIRDSDVLSTSAFFRNTFRNIPFKPIRGMPELFQKWNKELKYPAFHYVSGVPWQWNSLYEPFYKDFKFPEGPTAYQDLKFSKIFRFVNVQAFKTRSINTIISDFPDRKFLLLGDSGQYDPEVYASVYHKNPKNVLCIWIIRATTKSKLIGKIKAKLKNKSSRFEKAFKDIPNNKWFVFDNADQIKDIPFQDGRCK